MIRWLGVLSALLVTQPAFAESPLTPPGSFGYAESQQRAFDGQWINPPSGVYGSAQQYRGGSARGYRDGYVQQRQSRDVNVDAEMAMSFRSGGLSGAQGNIQQSRRFNANGSKSPQLSNRLVPNAQASDYYGWGVVPSGDGANEYYYQWQYHNARPDAPPPMVYYGYPPTGVAPYAPMAPQR